MAAVGTVVPVVTHHKVIRLLNNLWAVILMASELRRHEEVGLEYFVDIYLAVLNPHGVTLFGDDTFNERLVGIARVKQHNDVAPLGLTKEAVGCFVHDQSILILKGQLHAFTLDPRHLEAEGDDQGGVNGRRRKGFEPGQ